MAAQSSGSQNVDVRELFNLLESNDINVSNDICKLVQENLASTREAWIVYSLVDYYYISHSEKTLQILKEAREPHDKHLVDKLNEGLKTVEYRLSAMKILLCLACKQPIWIHKLVTHPIFHAIIKTLKTETDIPVVMTGVMVLTILLPSVPALIGSQLTEIFGIFSHLIAFNERKPGNVPDVFLLHLQVALYSLFHRLYGMFPYNFLTYLRHHYMKKENTAIFDEFVKPMLDRVRLHPHLITSSREFEVSSKRWHQMEAQDVVIECAKMSLDLTEGMWEELTCPILTPRHMVQHSTTKSSSVTNNLPVPRKDGNLRLVPPQHLNTVPQELSPPCHITGTDGIVLWSPSVIMGLSTPPPSQQTTPQPSSCLDTSRGTYGNTPLVTPPVDTPRATPPITSDLEKSFSRTSSRGLVNVKGSDIKRQSTGSMLSIKSQVGNTPFVDGKSGSVPPSPLRTEFTSEPPQGIFKPTRQAIRELKFDAITEGHQLPPVDQEICSSEATESEKADQTRGEDPNDKSDLMESFSMDTLPKVIEDFGGQDEEAEDMEVSELTRSTGTAATLTAESVQQFMKKVNRIRFNSLTNSSVPKTQKFGARSRSCPHLPKIESEDDDTDSLSRSVSATFKMISGPQENDSNSYQRNLNIPAFSDKSHCPVVDTSSSSEQQDKTTTGDGVPKYKSPLLCPVLASATKGNSPDGSQVTNSYSDLMRTLLMPASVLVCQKCNQTYADNNQSIPSGQVGVPMSFSPPELLDRHLQLGGEVHAKELSKIPITSQESISWTHFGGMPPADEVNILRGQIFMIQNQLMYERHKRELHAKRNRRLLRKIANAKAMEEQNSAMTNQLSVYETEIQNLKVSLRLLQEENRRYKETQESNEYESKVQMRACLTENEDLKSAKTELSTLLVRQREEQDLLKQSVQKTESKLFKTEKEKHHLQEEVQFTQKLKEQVFQLHKEVLLMGELHQHYQEQINSAKLHSKAKQDLHLTSQAAEIKALKKKLKVATFNSDACQARVSELEEKIKTKDIALMEIKQSFDKVKACHLEELKSIDEKYQTMLKINQQLEGQILQLYSQVDELNRPRHAHRPASTTGFDKSDYNSKKESSPSRDRTGSDPTVVTKIRKTPLSKTTSVPVYYEMKDDVASSQKTSQTDLLLSSASHFQSAVDSEVCIPSTNRQGVEGDTTSLSSRESSLFHFSGHRSTLSYSEGEDKSVSSRGSHVLDSHSGYST